jgi:cytochrome c553
VLLDVTTRRPGRKLILGLLVCVCLFAVVFTATVEAQHIHTDGSREAQRCTVCAAAHSPTLLSKVANVAPQFVGQALRPEYKAGVTASRTLDSDFIRPPPSA